MLLTLVSFFNLFHVVALEKNDILLLDSSGLGAIPEHLTDDSVAQTTPCRWRPLHSSVAELSTQVAFSWKGSDVKGQLSRLVVITWMWGWQWLWRCRVLALVAFLLTWEL